MGHLHKKLCRAMRSGRDILCIVKNRSRDGASRGFTSEEALAIQGHLETRRAERLRDIRERTQKPPCAS